mmetsp:Transcript_79667/g.213018  ORF Transcript_79667/g.213018 Transcript_79667/m.213018 type:complete len:330 (-) Transcript_79667:381-1370(-)
MAAESRPNVGSMAIPTSDEYFCQVGGLGAKLLANVQLEGDGDVDRGRELVLLADGLVDVDILVRDLIDINESESLLLIPPRNAADELAVRQEHWQRRLWLPLVTDVQREHQLHFLVDFDPVSLRGLVQYVAMDVHIIFIQALQTGASDVPVLIHHAHHGTSDPLLALIPDASVLAALAAAARPPHSVGLLHGSLLDRRPLRHRGLGLPRGESEPESATPKSPEPLGGRRRRGGGGHDVGDPGFWALSGGHGHRHLRAPGAGDARCGGGHKVGRELRGLRSNLVGHRGPDLPLHELADLVQGLPLHANQLRRVDVRGRLRNRLRLGQGLS